MKRAAATKSCGPCRGSAGQLLSADERRMGVLLLHVLQQLLFAVHADLRTLRRRLAPKSHGPVLCVQPRAVRAVSGRFVSGHHQPDTLGGECVEWRCHIEPAGGYGGLFTPGTTETAAGIQISFSDDIPPGLLALSAPQSFGGLAAGAERNFHPGVSVGHGIAHRLEPDAQL